MAGTRHEIAGRRVGAVEAQVLERLWEAGRPLGVREVLAGLNGRPRAYTTVLTMLTRLVDKGLVRRVPGSRSFAYVAAGTPADLAAEAIRDVVRASRDPRAVLARFVEEISGEPELVCFLADVLETRRRL